MCGVYNPRGPGVKLYASRDISEPHLREEVRASMSTQGFGVLSVSARADFSARFGNYEIVQAPTFGEAVAILMQRWAEQGLPEGEST
jgi:hypothetical protein